MDYTSAMDEKTKKNLEQFIEKLFDKNNQKLESLAKGQAGTNKILEITNKRIDLIQKRLDNTNKRLEGFIVTFLREINRLDEKIDLYRNEIDSFKDDLMTKIDAVYKEVLDMRQEQIVHFEQHSKINDRLDVVEAIPAVAHELKRKKAA